MSNGGSLRRGFAAALIVGGVLLVVTALLTRGNHTQTGGGDGDQQQRGAAAALRARLDQALQAATRALEPKATAAARLSEIVSGLDLEADPHTFQDLLENEDWWAPYRGEFPISGVISASGSIATLGPVAGDPSATQVVRQARELGVASGVIAMQGRPLMLAAARVPRGKRQVSGAVVILGAPLDRTRAAWDLRSRRRPGRDQRRQAPHCNGRSRFRRGRSGRAGRSGRKDQPRRGAERSRPAARSWPLASLASAARGPCLPRRRRRSCSSSSPSPARRSPAWAWRCISRRWAGTGVNTANPMVITQPFGSGTGSERLPGSYPEQTRDLRAPSAADLGGRDPRPRPRSVRATRRRQPVASTNDRAWGCAAPNLRGDIWRYRLIERIGEGGMAEIYTAATFGAEGFRRTFVVKRLRAAPRAPPRRRRTSSSTRRACSRRSCTRTSCPCSTSARSATSTSWPRSTSSGAISSGWSAPRRARLAGRSAPRRLLRRARDAAGAGVRAHAADRRQASRWASSTATSRPATSWSRRAAR